MHARGGCLGEATFMVYMYLSITPSFARRQGERSTTLDTIITPHSFRIAMRYSAGFQRPLVVRSGMKVERAAAACLIINHPQIPQTLRPQSGRPLDYELTAERPQNECFLAAAAAGESSHYIPLPYYYHLAHQSVKSPILCVRIIIGTKYWCKIKITSHATSPDHANPQQRSQPRSGAANMHLL